MSKLLSVFTFLFILLTICLGNPGILSSDSEVKTMAKKHTNNSSDKKHYNRLINEKSPYLLQHASNPVEWYPWGPEAFEKAMKENKPIFLSIGYSTCHWCHVMAHESFEDPEVAKLMNEAFICIKVDREERPDIDNIYMLVCRMVTGSGGWPLTIIMTPDKKPFFAGTYFPKKARFGRIGMLELVPRIKELWQTKHDDVLKSANQITAEIQQYSAFPEGKELDKSTLKTAYEQLAGRADEKFGGFGSAPKFPSPQNLLFLLRYWKSTGNEKALEMVEKTLQAMRNGGIYDHVGFGFHRYSTDAKWLVPHFEKMLYDQALLVIAYVETYQATNKKEYGDFAQEICTYVLRDMTDPNGGFYSAEDADSEGVEGKFYLWTEEEVRKILKDDADLIMDVFNIDEDGNFNDEATSESTETNILHLSESLTETATGMKLPVEGLKKRIETARQKLFDTRERRIHPHKDDKILVDWNGLMIAALAKSAQVFDKPEYADAAKRSVDFILKEMRRPDGRLLHRYRDGQSLVLANVDDYAFLIWGLLELYETNFDVHYLQTALDLNKELIKYFWDEQSGGFYFTANDAEALLVRQKEIYDGAIPSGNSVAMLNLLRLGRITADSGLEERAMKITSVFSQQVKPSPSGFAQLMAALDFGIGPSYEIVIVGGPQADDTNNMLNAIRKHFVPNKVVLFRPGGQESPDIARLAAYTKDLLSMDGKATAYVCLNYLCGMPTTDINKMLELLNVSSQ